MEEREDGIESRSPDSHFLSHFINSKTLSLLPLNVLLFAEIGIKLTLLGTGDSGISMNDSLPSQVRRF